MSKKYTKNTVTRTDLPNRAEPEKRKDAVTNESEVGCKLSWRRRLVTGAGNCACYDLDRIYWSIKNNENIYIVREVAQFFNFQNRKINKYLNKITQFLKFQ